MCLANTRCSVNEQGIEGRLAGIVSKRTADAVCKTITLALDEVLKAIVGIEVRFQIILWGLAVGTHRVVRHQAHTLLSGQAFLIGRDVVCAVGQYSIDDAYITYVLYAVNSSNYIIH